jgi:large subunit ribosomal protein L17e
MVKYSTEPKNSAKACKARITGLKVHFKKMRETAHAIKGMKLKKAMDYMQDVLDRKQGIAMKRFTGGAGRHAMGHGNPGNAIAWPQKAAKSMLDLLTNAQSNAELKGLDVDRCEIEHIQVNRAPKTRRRTYRAHGRIGPYMSNPCHVEMIVSEPSEGVKKAPAVQPKMTRKLAARIRQGKRVYVGGGDDEE